MTSQDDIAALRAMRERGEITHDEYTLLRRNVLRGIPLPPELSSGYRGPLGAQGDRRVGAQGGPPPPHRGEPARRGGHGSLPERWPPAGPDRGPGRPGDRRTDRYVESRDWADEPTGMIHPGEISGTDHPARRGRDTAAAAPGRALERRAPAAPARVVPRDRPLPAEPRPAARAMPRGAGRRRPAPGRRRRQATVLVAGVLVLALVGAGVWWFALRVSPVQPDIYAQRVCTTVGRWQSAMATAREQLVTTLAGKTAPDGLRAEVVTFYQDAEERTAKLSVAIADIGPPNVVGGNSYAVALRQAVATTASSFHDDAERAGELDTSSRAIFASQVQSEVASIDSRTQPVFDALSGRGLEPPLALRTAFDSDPTCAAYTG